MTSRGLTAGSLLILYKTPRGRFLVRIFQVQGGDQGFGVGGNWFLMLLQAFDVARYGVLRHLPGLGQCPPVGDAAWQSRHYGGKSALRFWPEHDVVMVARLWHWI